MRAFAESLDGLPDNVCAMSTVTDTGTLHRVDELRMVKAACSGISVEPLRERIPPEALDLTGIDWLILGGESGTSRVFDLSWEQEIREHCRINGVAYFLKQLGRNPVADGNPMRFKDTHGGYWEEWPTELRVREFPDHFHKHRRYELAEHHHELTGPSVPAYAS